MKKVLIIVLALAALGAFALTWASRKAPELLREALAMALDKDVTIQSIQYHFPNAFEMQGFEVREKAPFQGEKSFGVETLRLVISPISLSRRELLVDKVEAELAEITVRKIHGKLFHALSSAAKKPGEETDNPGVGAAGGGARRTIPLKIREFIVKKGHFRFVDFDAPQESGFVFTLDPVEVKVQGIALPFAQGRTVYDLAARLLQGRDQQSAEMRFVGWTDFSNTDTDALLQIRGVHLPYFKPYYGQVTRAAIAEGYLNSRAALRIERKDLTAHVDFEIVNLLFESYEFGNQLFGLRAEEMLAFLKDSSGRLKFQIVARWNLADRTIKSRDVIRKSIERSLKNTVLGDIVNILENAVKGIAEGGVEKSKDEVGSTIKKIKELLKY